MFVIVLVMFMIMFMIMFVLVMQSISLLVSIILFSPELRNQGLYLNVSGGVSGNYYRLSHSGAAGSLAKFSFSQAGPL